MKRFFGMVLFCGVLVTSGCASTQPRLVFDSRLQYLRYCQHYLMHTGTCPSESDVTIKTN